MDFVLPLLAMFVLLAALVYFIYSREQSEKRKKDSTIRESGVANAGDSHSGAS